jgi:protocatechuate 3,4-dioxygenase beta subunit
MSSRLSRRTFLLGGVAAVSSVCVRGARAWPGADARFPYEIPDSPGERGITLPPTPACDPGPAPATRPQIEGPFYTPATPERASLVGPSVPGRRVRLVGRVLTTDCEPMAGAVLDFWQADSEGEYDNRGFGLRGHQFADRSGLFSLETIEPGAYRFGWGRRTPHLHVKVRGDGTSLLTTQLYFPHHEEENQRDALFREELLMQVRDGADGALEARFDFVLKRPERSEGHR